MLLCSKLPSTCLRHELVCKNPGGIPEARKDLCPESSSLRQRVMQVFDLGLWVTVRNIQIQGMMLTDCLPSSGSPWDVAHTGPSQPTSVSLSGVVLIESHRVGIALSDKVVPSTKPLVRAGQMLVCVSIRRCHPWVCP